LACFGPFFHSKSTPFSPVELTMGETG
jgi:hypothetical protein